jgi:hypothetical protein
LKRLGQIGGGGDEPHSAAAMAMEIGQHPIVGFKPVRLQRQI